MIIFSKDDLIKAVSIPVIIALTPFFLLMFLSWLVRRLWLNTRFRIKWGKKDKHILFIYSESPNWQQYIETNIVPRINQKAVLLNWSKRSEWKTNKPLEAKVLEHWGSEREFNPLAIVFMPRGMVKVIRFHKAFKDYKHGKEALLKRKEKELYGVL